MPEKRADSPASSARYVRCRLLDTPDTFAHCTAQLLRRMTMTCLPFGEVGAARASEPEEKDWTCQEAFAAQKCSCKRSMALAPQERTSQKDMTSHEAHAAF